MDKPQFKPFSFDDRVVILVAPLLVAGLALAVNLSPLAFFLGGFHVWMHELGHATVAWLTGRQALPLPIGWTSIGSERSAFVYFGVLFLLAVFFAAAWRQRMVGPMVLAVLLAVLQAYMTWRLPEYRQRLWQIFGGVGGQFYLSALLMAGFFFPLPEKFKWGACRYVVFFIAASCFFDVFAQWSRVHRGQEAIPWGSMINGEDDGGGDMNILRDEYRWRDAQIASVYHNLGRACLAALLLVYVAAALNLNRLPDSLLTDRSREG